MNDRLDLLVTDWLRADAPAEASPRTLEGALARVATASQERYVTQRLLGDRIGRRRDVRLALVLGLLVLAIAGAFAIAGALLREQPKPVGPLSNGSIVFRANGAAGSDLSGPVVDVRAGESDMFAVEVGGQPRRIVGDDLDHDIQMCPTVSPDGTRLAYLALDSTTITPTPAPVPAGQSFGPNPSYVGPLSLWFEIVGLDANGTPSGEARRIAIPPTADGGVGCPRWSPDGTRLAFTIDLPEGGRQLFVVGPDATLTTLARGGAFDWGPDGRQMVVGDIAAWLVPVDGGAARTLIGVVPNAVAWSPDGSRIAIRTPVELLVVTPDGRVVFRGSRPQDDSPVVLWAPDGSRLAEAYGGRIHLTTPDGTRSTTLEIDVAALFPDATPDADFTPGIGLVAWSPDSRRLLLTASPMFDQNALITVDPDGHEPPVVVLGPSLALRGVRAQQASWQGVGR